MATTGTTGGAAGATGGTARTGATGGAAPAAGAVATGTLGYPSISDLLSAASTVDLADTGSVTCFGTTKKREVFDAFKKFADGELDPSQNPSATLLAQGWAVFLLALADNGGSEKLESRMRIIVYGRNNTKVLGGLVHAVLSDMKREVPEITGLRLLNSFADEVSSLLKLRGKMTDWGRKHGLDNSILEFSFPGALFCSNINPKAQEAIALAAATTLPDDRLTQQVSAINTAFMTRNGMAASTSTVPRLTY